MTSQRMTSLGALGSVGKGDRHHRKIGLLMTSQVGGGMQCHRIWGMRRMTSGAGYAALIIKTKERVLVLTYSSSPDSPSPLLLLLFTILRFAISLRGDGRIPPGWRFRGDTSSL